MTTNISTPNYTLDEFFIETQDNESLTLLRLSSSALGVERQPIICLHGSYSNRKFWLSDKGKGLAAHLFEVGFDVWILEFRGRGSSPIYKDAKKTFSMHEMAFYDLPSVHRFVQTKTNKTISYVCHSMGGNTLLQSLAENFIEMSTVKAMVLIGSQTTQGHEFLKYSLVRCALKILMKCYGFFPAKKLKLGPENESQAFMLKAVERRTTQTWKTSSDQNVFDLLSNISTPVFCLTSIGDTQDPEEGVHQVYKSFGSKNKKYVCLSMAKGYLEDYTHVGMVVSASAQKETWPMISDWLLNLN